MRRERPSQTAGNENASTPKDGCRMNIEMREEEEHAGLITEGSSEPGTALTFARTTAPKKCIVTPPPVSHCQRQPFGQISLLKNYFSLFIELIDYLRRIHFIYLPSPRSEYIMKQRCLGRMAEKTLRVSEIWPEELASCEFNYKTVFSFPCVTAQPAGDVFFSVSRRSLFLWVRRKDWVSQSPFGSILLSSFKLF